MRDYRDARLDSFEPIRDLKSVVGWWDFSAVTGAVGASVTRVPDISGFAQDLIQPSAALQPTVQAGPLSKKVVRFTGAQRLRAQNFGLWPRQPISQPMTAIIVCKPSSSAPDNSYRMLVRGNATGGTISLLMDNRDATAYAAANNSGMGPSGPNLNDSWHVVVGVWDTAAQSVYVDGWLTAAGSGLSSTTDSLKDLTIGATSTGASPLYGDVAEVLICGGALTHEQVSAATTYFAEKWGINANGTASAPVDYEQTTSSNGQGVRIWTPKTLSSPTTLVLYQHVSGGNEQLYPGYVTYPFVHAAIQKGWIVAASALHGENWGNPQGLADLLDAYNLVNGRSPVSKVILVGASMGGLVSSLAVAKGTVPNIKGVYLMDAVSSLSSMYESSVSYRAYITTAYSIVQGTLTGSTAIGATSLPTTATYASGVQLRVGIGTANVETVTTTGASNGSSVAVTALTKTHASADIISDYPTKTATHDPVLFAASAYAGTRFRFIASPNDALVSKSLNTDAMRTLIGGSVPESGLIARVGAHLGPGGQSPADFVAFVERAIA